MYWKSFEKIWSEAHSSWLPTFLECYLNHQPVPTAWHIGNQILESKTDWIFNFLATRCTEHQKKSNYFWCFIFLIILFIWKKHLLCRDLIITSCIFLAFFSFKLAEVEALVAELQYIYPCSLQLGSFYSL